MRGCHTTRARAPTDTASEPVVRAIASAARHLVRVTNSRGCHGRLVEARIRTGPQCQTLATASDEARVAGWRGAGAGPGWGPTWGWVRHSGGCLGGPL